MKKLIVALLLGAFLVTTSVGVVGCKEEKKEEKKKTEKTEKKET